MAGSGNSSMTELIRYITNSLVDNTDKVDITEVEGTQTNVIELRVAKEDIGKVIGKNGKTADAIRTLLNCGGAKVSKRYILHIIDGRDKN